MRSFAVCIKLAAMQGEAIVSNINMVVKFSMKRLKSSRLISPFYKNPASVLLPYLSNCWGTWYGDTNRKRIFQMFYSRSLFSLIKLLQWNTDDPTPKRSRKYIG